jgi:hypothetical protein
MSELLISVSQGYGRQRTHRIHQAPLDTWVITETIIMPYIAPEVMCRQNHCCAVDYFALGVIGYEFMLGRVTIISL